MKSKKRLILVLSLIITVLLFAGCGSDRDSDELTQIKGKLEEIQTRGELLVGTAGDYQPMSFLNPDTGRYEGFDAELAEDLADALGVKLADLLE